jgi:hypothetical protein
LELGPALPAVEGIDEWEMTGTIEPEHSLDSPPAFAPLVFARLAYSVVVLARGADGQGATGHRRWSLHTLGDACAREQGELVGGWPYGGDWQYVGAAADGRLWAVLDDFREAPSDHLLVLSSADGGRTWTARRLDKQWYLELFADLEMDSRGHGWLATVIDDDGAGFRPGRYVYATQDGGRTWEPPRYDAPPPPPRHLRSSRRHEPAWSRELWEDFVAKAPERIPLWPSGDLVEVRWQEWGVGGLELAVRTARPLPGRWRWNHHPRHRSSLVIEGTAPFLPRRLEVRAENGGEHPLVPYVELHYADTGGADRAEIVFTTPRGSVVESLQLVGDDVLRLRLLPPG